MTYYEDLTPYEYMGDPPGTQSLNVGWLSYYRPFAKGETSQEFKDKLLEYCKDTYVVNVARGFHTCEFCDVSDEHWAEQSESRYGDDTHWLNIGDGEIRVIGTSAVYAAPTLV